MIKSMTGYGKGCAVSSTGSAAAELRSVNHRYGEISVRLPRQFMAVEAEVKRRVAAVLKRGKIDVVLQWDEGCGAESSPQINGGLARRYHDAFRALCVELGQPAEVPLSLILSQRGVLCDAPAEIDEAEVSGALLEAVDAAVTAADLMRTREGEALQADLSARRSEVERLVSLVRDRAPLMVADAQQKLLTRVQQLVSDIEIDQARIAQEVALLADRSDVTEELVRLNSHFEQFDAALQLNEPVGRKLDFLMQEMNREVNTIGSKANDVTVASLVIQLKAELEKMREQVQNIE